MPTDSETATSYAALILADEHVDITAEKLQTLLKAAGIEDIEPIWTTLFAKALQGKDIKDLLTSVTTTGPTAGQQSGVGGISDPNDGRKDGDGADGDKSVEDDDESDGDIGLSLFDD